MASSRVQTSTSRDYRHTVKRQLEATLTLPQIQKHGFTHPANGRFLMLPEEFDVLLGLEHKAVAAVVLAILRRTIGVVGNGPRDRGLWVKLSLHALADASHLSYCEARRGGTDMGRRHAAAPLQAGVL